jgi:hypothetical protein
MLAWKAVPKFAGLGILLSQYVTTRLSQLLLFWTAAGGIYLISMPVGNDGLGADSARL